MSVLVDRTSRVLIQGITGREGSFHTAQMRAFGTNIVAGYEICAVAPNGAPDCAGASLALCKANGFARGNSLDITSSFKCPAQMYREGRAPNPQDCRDESFVSKAVCQ